MRSKDILMLGALGAGAYYLLKSSPSRQDSGTTVYSLFALPGTGQIKTGSTTCSGVNIVPSGLGIPDIMTGQSVWSPGEDLSGSVNSILNPLMSAVGMGPAYQTVHTIGGMVF